MRHALLGTSPAWFLALAACAAGHATNFNDNPSLPGANTGQTGGGTSAGLPGGSTSGGAPVPGRVQAEAYQETSAPLQLQASQDLQGGGQVIVATQPNTRVRYAINVQQAGSYAVSLRSSAPAQDGNFTVAVGDRPGIATHLRSTGADNAFTNQVVRNVLLAAGPQSLYVSLDANTLRLDWLDIVPTASVPVAHPARLGWSNMDEGALAAAPAQWTYVAAHLDLLEWGNNNLTQLAAAAAALSPNATIALTAGALGPFSGPTPNTWASDAANSINDAIDQVQAQAHVKVSLVDINQDPVGPLQSLCLASPANSNVQIAGSFAAALQSVVSAVHTVHPQTRMAVFLGTPVNTTWQGQPAFGGGPGGMVFNPLKDTSNNPVMVQGKPVSFQFDTFPILAEYYANAGAAANGYITDSPAEYFAAGGAVYQNKILAYERWLQAIDQPHMLITDRYNCSSTSPAGADMCYYNAILDYLHDYQAAGGRADTYLIFQLHNGPANTLPETTAYTFANTMMDAIKYIQGPGQQLDLTVQGLGGGIYEGVPQADQSVVASPNAMLTVQLTNHGEVAAMPVLRAQLQGDGASLPSLVQQGGTDMSEEVLHGGGHVFTERIAPGASITCQVVWPSLPSTLPAQLTLEVLWNPQDPSGSVRDAVRITGP